MRVPIEAFHVLACGTGLAMRRCAAVPRATLRRLTPTLARVAGAKPVGSRPSNTPRMPFGSLAADLETLLPGNMFGATSANIMRRNRARVSARCRQH